MKRPSCLFLFPMMGVSLLALLASILIASTALAQRAEQLYKDFQNTFDGLPPDCKEGKPEQYIDALKYLFAYSEVDADFLVRHQAFKQEVDLMLMDLQDIAENIDVCLDPYPRVSGICPPLPAPCSFNKKLSGFLRHTLPLSLPSSSTDNPLPVTQRNWIWIPQQNDDTCGTTCAAVNAEPVNMGIVEACATHEANELDKPFLHLGYMRPGGIECQMRDAENLTTLTFSTFSCLCALKSDTPPPPLSDSFQRQEEALVSDVAAPRSDNSLPRETEALISDVAASRSDNSLPRLISPQPKAEMDNGCTERGRDIITWTFVWNDVPNAQSYHLVVTNPRKEPSVFDVNKIIRQTSYYRYSNPRYIADNIRRGWTWRVRAQIDKVWGPWSNEQKFNVEPVGTDCR